MNNLQRFRFPSYEALSVHVRCYRMNLKLRLAWNALGIEEELLISDEDKLIAAEDRLLEELTHWFPLDEEVVSVFREDTSNRVVDWPIPFKGFSIDWALNEEYDEFLPLLCFLNVVPAWAKNYFDQRAAEFWLLYHDSPWNPWLPWLDYREEAEEILGKLPPPWNGLKVVFQVLVGENENPFLDSCGICGDGFVMEFDWSPDNLKYLKERYEEIKRDLDAFVAYRNVWYSIARHEGELEALEKVIGIILEAE
jgi:hypothetical protein